MIRDFWWRTGQRAISVEARRLGLLLGGLLVCGALLAALAHAAQVTCGQTISQGTNVGNNLKNCPADGLIIDTDGVAIDLQGHTIDGVGEGAGIRLLPDVDGVTIKNGTIKQFDDGILGEDSNDQFELHNLTLKDNDGNGANIRAETDVLMRNSQAVGNGVNGFSTRGEGIVMKNLVAEDQNTSNGIDLQGEDITVQDSQVSNNPHGLFVRDQQGSVPSENVTITNVRALGNTVEGIFIEAVNARAIGNTTNDNDDGIRIDDGSSQIALKKNVAKSNDDDGIDVDTSSAALTANVANNNGGFGIEAVAGVIDFGDNSASGNGAAPPECENVDCD